MWVKRGPTRRNQRSARLGVGEAGEHGLEIGGGPPVASACHLASRKGSSMGSHCISCLRQFIDAIG